MNPGRSLINYKKRYKKRDAKITLTTLKVYNYKVEHHLTRNDFTLPAMNEKYLVLGCNEFALG